MPLVRAIFAGFLISMLQLVDTFIWAACAPGEGYLCWVPGITAAAALHILHIGLDHKVVLDRRPDAPPHGKAQGQTVQL